MTSSKLPRFLYRILLRLHPYSFRVRFQDEMLWVFEEQARHEKLSSLLLDGLRSLLVQHANSSQDLEPVQTGFALEIATSSLSSRRMLQAALGATVVTIGFALLLDGSSNMPSAPLAVAIRRHSPSFCDQPVPMRHVAKKNRFAHKAIPERSR